MHVTWYTAMSMDGRIAGPGDDLDFLETVGEDGDGSDFEAFMAGVDAIVMGSSTLRWLVREGHALPYRGIPIWLLSHDEQLAADAAAADEDTPVTRVEGGIAPVFEAIAAAGHEHVWICGGGDVAAQALAAECLDEVILTIAPTALGAGPTIFDGAALPQNLFTLAECRRYAEDSVRLRWLRRKEPT